MIVCGMYCTNACHEVWGVCSGHGVSIGIGAAILAGEHDERIK